MATATARHAHPAARLSIGLALAVVLVIAVVAIFVVLVDPNAVANRVTQQALPQVSQSLGRKVTVDHVEVGWFPMRVVLHGLRVAGGPNEPELVQGDASIKPRLWPLIKSRGRDVEISKITLRDPQLNLVQLPDGTWDLPKPQPSQPSQRTVAIDEFSVERGAVRLFQAGKGAQPDPLLAVNDIHLVARDVAQGAPLKATLDASFAPEKADARNIHAELALSALPADASQLPGVTGSIHLDRAQLATLHALMPASAQGLLQGGALTFDAQLSGGGGKALEVRGKAALDGASLRGQPARGSLAFDATPAQLTIKDLALDGPGVKLGGNATASLAQKRVRFSLSGPLLDLDALLGVLPPSKGEKAPSQGLSAQARQQLEALDVSGTLAVQKVVVHKLQASDLQAEAKLEKGTLVLPRAQAKLYGGALDASGATIDLTQAKPRWSMQARLDGVDLGVATQQVAGEQPLNGKATGSLALRGEGSDWSTLRQNLTGQGALKLADAALPHTNLGAQLAGPLKAALPGKLGGAAASAAGGTPLKDVALGFAVRNGFLELSQPLAFSSDFGSAQLGGRIGLDWRLELSGNVSLAPGFLAQLSGGALKPAGATSLPVKIGGTLSHPALQPAQTGAALASSLMGASPVGKAIQQGQNQAKKQIESQARRGLQKILRP